MAQRRRSRHAGVSARRSPRRSSTCRTRSSEGGHGVNAHGFDEAWVYYGGGADYFNRRTVQGRGPVSWWHNLEFRPQDEGYTDDLVTQHAIEFIRENKDRPFFCYVPFHIAHAPLQAKENDLAAIDPKKAAKLPAASEKTTDEDKHIHAAMLHSMDKNVAAILRRTREARPEREHHLRLHQRQRRDGSRQQPAAARPQAHHLRRRRAPAHGHSTGPRADWSAARNGTDSAARSTCFPTLMAMTGSTMPQTRPLDGKNIWPALRDNQPSPVESYYWVWRDEDAIRTDKWKLHRFFDRYELYDITKDETESNNVAEAHPDVVKSLTAKMDAWADSHRRRAQPPARARQVSRARRARRRGARRHRDHHRQGASPRIAWPSRWRTGTARNTPPTGSNTTSPSRPAAPKRHPYFSTLEGNNSQTLRPALQARHGVDQFGRDQSTGPGIADGKSIWEHRIVGLSSTAPGPLGKHGVVFTGGKAGTFTIYLDNLRIRHADGSTTPLWTNGKDTRAGKFKANELFKDLKIRAVKVAEVGR